MMTRRRNSAATGMRSQQASRARSRPVQMSLDVCWASLTTRPPRATPTSSSSVACSTSLLLSTAHTTTTSLLLLLLVSDSFVHSSFFFLFFSFSVLEGLNSSAFPIHFYDSQNGPIRTTCQTFLHYIVSLMFYSLLEMVL